MLDVALHKRLATVELDVSFQLGPEILVLFGPSGAGKSLTLKSIAGIETPDAGHIRSGERVLFDAAAGVNLPPQRRRVGYVPQHYALFPHLSALENVAFPLRKGLRWPAERAEARARELLDQLGLLAHADARPRRLSGGQQQRVALARALAGEPEILLLDEPFAALDAPIRAELRAELRALQARLRVPTLFVTHDLEEAATLAGRLAVMIAGRVRQLDRTRVVLDRPADRQVAELVQARNIIPGVVACTPDGAVVRTALGAVELGPRLLDDGRSVYLVIRPEAIRLGDPDRPLERFRHDLLVPGTAVDVVDHGTRTVVHVAVPGQTLEASLSPPAAARRRLEPGTAVTLAIPHADIHVMPAEPSP